MEFGPDDHPSERELKLQVSKKLFKREGERERERETEREREREG